MRFAADMSVLLSYWKLRDAERDGRLLHRLVARLALLFYRPAYRRAARRHGEANRIFDTQLQKLNALEEACCPSIDRTADAFASLLKACALYFPEGARRRTTELLLYHVGRFLYLTDALEDLPRDNNNGSYNPLRYRYTLQDGVLSAQDKAQLLESVDASISMAASAYELLPQAQEIVRNIIYYGLPAVLHSVAQGSFRRRRVREERNDR